MNPTRAPTCKDYLTRWMSRVAQATLLATAVSMNVLIGDVDGARPSTLRTPTHEVAGRRITNSNFRQERK